MIDKLQNYPAIARDRFAPAPRFGHSIITINQPP